MLKNSKIVVALLIASTCLTACSNSGPGGSGGTSPGGALDSCNGVVTDAKVAAFNQKQNEFSVAAGGANVYCKAEVNENGQMKKVEIAGHAQIRILPGLQYLRTELDSGPKPDRMYFQRILPTEEDIKSIHVKMGLPYVTGASPSFTLDATNYPSYLRFEKGPLFYVQNANTIKEHDVDVLVFVIAADPDQSDTLSMHLAQFLMGKVSAELLWYPQQTAIARQIANLAPAPIRWSQLSAESVVVSLVRENNGASSQVLNRAIELVDYWALKVDRIHVLLPELYNHALSAWQNPTIADNTAPNLVRQMRYILAVNPNSPLKATLAAYEKIKHYQGSMVAALKAAVAYVAGKSWTSEQFSLLVEVSEKLYAAMGSRTWEFAQILAKRTNCDRPASVFAAAVGRGLGERNLLNDSDSNSMLEKIFGKIQAGLNEAKLGLYFSVFDSLKADLRADSAEAEIACDELILSGKLTAQNWPHYYSVLKWMKDSAYVGFSEAYKIAKVLAAGGALEPSRVDLFKSIFTWLKDTVYVSRSEALSRAAEYLAHANFSTTTFAELKSYFEWLNGSLYLNRPEALKKAEEAIVGGGLTAPQVAAIRSLTTWYFDNIHLSRTEALDRAEGLVLIKKVSPENLTVMKEIVLWLVNEMYVSRNEAAEKGEALVTAPVPITEARARLYREYAKWLVSEMYVNRSEALEKSEKLVLQTGLDAAQVDLLKLSVKWLTSALYINRTEALAKGEIYLTKAKLTSSLFEALKQEYNAQIQLHKPREEALKTAESKVLGL